MSTFNTSNTNTFVVANWEWADNVLANSDYATFEVDDCDFDTVTGNHNYFDAEGNVITVTPDGEVVAAE